MVETNGIQVLDMRSEVSASLIGDIYRELLRPSFVSNELDSLETLLDGLAEDGSSGTWGLCAVDGETPLGCVLGYPYAGSRVLLIGYVTVRPGLRDRGIGGLLMDQIQQRWYQKDDVVLVLAEVEDPRYHPATPDVDPKRRAAFYGRRGAQVIVGPYFQPRLDQEGKQRVYNLFLTVLGGNSEAITPESSVRAGVVAEFLVEYFTQSGEGGDWPRAGDEEGTRLLNWYRDRELVRLHPIGDYAKVEIPRLGL
jgi:GNAT superfamily N-acetyltransferase